MAWFGSYLIDEKEARSVLEKGTDVNVRDKNSATPLQLERRGEEVEGQKGPSGGKQCAACGAEVAAGLIKCSKCGSGMFCARGEFSPSCAGLLPLILYFFMVFIVGNTIICARLEQWSHVW